jgi:hypothetical protein
MSINSKPSVLKRIYDAGEFLDVVKRELVQPDFRVRKTLKVTRDGQLYFFNKKWTRFELSAECSREFCKTHRREFDYHYDDF